MNRRLFAIPLILTLALAGPALSQPGSGDSPSREGDRPSRDRIQERRSDDGPRDRERGERSRDRDRDRDRDDRNRHDRDGKRPGAEKIDPADLELAIEVLEEFRPRTAEEMRELAKTDPEKAAENVARSFPRIVDFIEMKKRSPQRFELHLKSMRTMRAAWPLYREYYEARQNNDKAKMQALKKQIREHVATMFDIRVELHRLEIEELRKQVQELEKEIEQHDANRDELIDQRLQESLERRHRRDRGDPKSDEDRSEAGDSENE